MDVRVMDDPSTAVADWIGRRLGDAIRRRGAAHLAVSGGGSAPPMLGALAGCDVEWRRVTVWQVDERVVSDGHPDRNAMQLDGFPARVRPMPVTAKDLGAAARRYGAALPERLDVVHLGVGDDGHTASWPPGDPVVDSRVPCAVVDEFHGHRRMTLTPRAVNGARTRIVLVTGAAKAPVVARWLLRDPALPIDRVRRTGTTACFDPAAAADLPRPEH